MPFQSKAQRRFMFAKHPEMAKRWQAHTSKDAELPEHVKKEAVALGRKLAIALQPQQLVPGAPPVNRIPTAQQPPASPAAQGIPRLPHAGDLANQQQQPVQPAPQGPQGPKAPLTATTVSQHRQSQPAAINNSEAVIAEQLNKMAAVAYMRVLGWQVRHVLGG